MVHGYVRQLPSSSGDKREERRLFERQETRIEAILQVHGRCQNVLIHNISRVGIKLKDAYGLMPGDIITAELSRRTLEGTVVWSVPPYTGIALDTQLADDDPLLTPTIESTGRWRLPHSASDGRPGASGR
jgi:hypothetical protein